jgi:hypothetical protein
VCVCVCVCVYGVCVCVSVCIYRTRSRRIGDRAVWRKNIPQPDASRADVRMSRRKRASIQLVPPRGLCIRRRLGVL